MSWCGIWVAVMLLAACDHLAKLRPVDARRSVGRCGATPCGNVLRDVRCLMCWIRISPVFRSPSVVSYFADRPEAF